MLGQQKVTKNLQSWPIVSIDYHSHTGLFDATMVEDTQRAMESILARAEKSSQKVLIVFDMTQIRRADLGKSIGMRKQYATFLKSVESKTSRFIERGAVVHSSPMIRALIRMISLTAPWGYPVEYFETRREAYSWISSERE